MHCMYVSYNAFMNNLNIDVLIYFLLVVIFTTNAKHIKWKN